MTTVDTTPTTPTTPKSYLMWIGAEHYPTIADFVNEAVERGISKRVATPEIAAKVAEPGTLVYLAHDEGARVDCPECQTEIENPEFRKAEQALAAANVTLENRIRDAKAAKAEADKAKGDSTVSDEDKAARTAASARAQKLADNARNKSIKLSNDLDALPKTVKAGSGGHVILKDGTRWDYRRYMYWRNQPKKWDYKAEVAELHMCEHCGGFGQLPVGKVFGVFMPDAAEYLLAPEDRDELRKEMKDKGLETVEATVWSTEVKRGCGRRAVHGSYIVTKTTMGATPEQLDAALKELVAKGVIKPKDTKVDGSFAEFVAPVDIPGEKRFRGIKEWDPTPDAADEGEMIVDAIAS